MSPSIKIMRFFRSRVNSFYDSTKPILFQLTQKDPEKAHHYTLQGLDKLKRLGIASVLLKEPITRNVNFELANAAGFNKNGEIHPEILHWMGFDRVVIGSVSGQAWKGNDKPRCFRFPGSKSLINRLGLPGEGAEAVCQRLKSYKKNKIPITLNLIPTPNPEWDLQRQLKDLRFTTKTLKNSPGIDRFELNIACPNTSHGSSQEQLDRRSEYQKNTEIMIDAILSEIKPSQKLEIKISPDMTHKETDEILSICQKMPITGIVACNTSTRRPEGYFSSEHTKERGGVSGKAVYAYAFDMQKYISKKNIPTLAITACGGIDNPRQINEALSLGITRIQIYTALIFKGLKLLSEINKYQYAKPLFLQ